MPTSQLPAAGCEQDILPEDFQVFLSPPERTYTSSGGVVHGATDTYSKARSAFIGTGVAIADKSTAVEKEEEEYVEEVQEVYHRAKEKWNKVRGLFLQQENPEEKKEMMCGIIVTTLPSDGNAYTVKMENTSSLQRIVKASMAGDAKEAVATRSADFDFTGSDNLVIEDLEVDGIEVLDPLKAAVRLNPGQVLGLKLKPVDEAKGTALQMSVAPGAQTDTKKLSSGAVLVSSKLSQCRGYDLAFNNPTDHDIMLDFDFSQSANLILAPHISKKAQMVEVSGFNASILIPAGAVDCNFVSLRTEERDRPVRLQYKMTEPSKATTETLGCNVRLVTVPLRRAGGFQLSLESLNPKAVSLTIDFSASKNLRIEGGAGVNVSGTKASVSVKPRAQLDPFVTLSSIEGGKGILLKYAVTYKDA